MEKKSWESVISIFEHGTNLAIPGYICRMERWNPPLDMHRTQEGQENEERQMGSKIDDQLDELSREKYAETIQDNKSNTTKLCKGPCQMPSDVFQNAKL